MQPGPIKPLDPSAYDLAVDPAEFADAAAADLAGLDSEDQVHADVSNQLTDLASTPIEQMLGPGLDDAAAELGYQTDSTAAAPADDAQADADLVGMLIQDGYTEIPGEAWEPQPQPFSAPVGTTSVPTEPPPSIIIPPTPPGIQPPSTPIWPPPPWVGITNLTHRGEAFRVGDQWQVDVQGNTQATVSMSGTQDGAAFGPADLGTTNDNGHFIVQGHMTRAEVGHWEEDWFVNGQKCWPGTITFDVSE